MKKLTVKISQITLSGKTKYFVDARELWGKIGSKQEFSNWIKERIQSFIHGKDYFIYGDGSHDKSSGRFTPIEYSISIDMAIFCCVMAKNNRGIVLWEYLSEEKEKLNQPKGFFRRLFGLFDFPH